MRRPLRLLFLIACALMLAIGLIFGGLNSAPVAIDLYWLQFEAGLGSALLAAALVGALLAGGCLWLAVILPLSARLSRSERTLQRTTALSTRGEPTQDLV